MFFSSSVLPGFGSALPEVGYGIPATTRASFGIYTTTAEIDALITGLAKVQEMFG